MDLPGDEQAKAIQKAAKLAQQVAETGKKFVDGPLEQLGGWASEAIASKWRMWR